MKNLIYSLAIVLTSTFSFGQIQDDTSKFTFPGGEIIIVTFENDSLITSSDTTYFKKKKSGPEPGDFERWGGFFFGVNGYLTASNNRQLFQSQRFMELDYTRSPNFTLNLPGKRFAIGGNRFGITTGIGFEFNRYGLKRNVSLGYNSDSTFHNLDTAVQYDKNFLKATFIHAPLLLEYNTSLDPDKGLYVGLGVIGGYRIGSKTKQKYLQNGKKQTDKSKGDYNLNPFKLSFTARLGYGRFTVFANYSMTELFDPGRGPELYPFSAGLSIIPF